ncbi:MAG: Mur ligase domain-containing protein, partial [Gemmatimonadota bacterium]|nr:Mur ligase domain-containing protein [Gemmatimonadota bacterium]
MEFTTADIIASIGEAELKGPEHMITYRRVCTDTRGDCHGALFAAIEGERFDGNAFIRAAADSGAAGALIGPSSAGVPVPQSL